MRAPFNKTARAYFLRPDGSIGDPSGNAFPCRLVTSSEISGEGQPAPGPWLYMTCNRLFVTPTLVYTSGSSIVVADYESCSIIAVPADGPPTWLALWGQLVTPQGEPSYYRWTLIPNPFS